MDIDTIGEGVRNVNENEDGAEDISKDDMIRRLQAELDQLKGAQGMRSSTQKFRPSQSPVSKRKNASQGQ